MKHEDFFKSNFKKQTFFSAKSKICGNNIGIFHNGLQVIAEQFEKQIKKMEGNKKKVCIGNFDTIESYDCLIFLNPPNIEDAKIKNLISKIKTATIVFGSNYNIMDLKNLEMKFGVDIWHCGANTSNNMGFKYFNPMSTCNISENNFQKKYDLHYDRAPFEYNKKYLMGIVRDHMKVSFFDKRWGKYGIDCFENDMDGSKFFLDLPTEQEIKEGIVNNNVYNSLFKKTIPITTHKEDLFPTSIRDSIVFSSSPEKISEKLKYLIKNPIKRIEMVDKIPESIKKFHISYSIYNFWKTFTNGDQNESKGI